MPIKNKTCKVCANTTRKHKCGISISVGILASSKVFLFAVTNLLYIQFCRTVNLQPTVLLEGSTVEGHLNKWMLRGPGHPTAPSLQAFLWSACLRA